MKAKERNEKIVLGTALIVTIAAIIATMGNQLIYIFWAVIPIGWLILFRRSQELDSPLKNGLWLRIGRRNFTTQRERKK